MTNKKLIRQTLLIVFLGVLCFPITFPVIIVSVITNYLSKEDEYTFMQSIKYVMSEIKEITELE